MYRVLLALRTAGEDTGLGDMVRRSLAGGGQGLVKIFWCNIVSIRPACPPHR
jgi:hypothetical protein